MMRHGFFSLWWNWNKVNQKESQKYNDLSHMYHIKIVSIQHWTKATDLNIFVYISELKNRRNWGVEVYLVTLTWERRHLILNVVLSFFGFILFGQTQSCFWAQGLFLMECRRPYMVLRIELWSVSSKVSALSTLYYCSICCNVICIQKLSLIALKTTILQ